MSRTALALAAVLWLGIVVLTSVAAPLLARNGPIQPVAAPLAGAGGGLVLGTDELGRDLWARLVYGGRLSLTASVLAAALSISLGIIAGLIAAAEGGWVERLVLWGANAMLAIPGLLLAMMLLAAFGPGLRTIVLAVGLSGAPGFARLARSVFAAPRQSAYVGAAVALGASRPWVAVRHLLPNARTQLVSLATTYFAWAFLGTTTLTFLGLAGDPTLPEWGSMLNSGRSHLVDAPQVALWPGLAIAATVLAVQYLGGWLAARPDRREVTTPES